MAAVDAAWLAGFIDGEGSILQYLGGANKKSVCWVLNVPNTNLEALEKCKRIAGVGNIGYKRVQGNRKDQWQWRVTRFNDIVSLVSK